MVPLIGGSSTSFDVYTPFYLNQCHHHRLELWNLYFLQPPYLQRYVDAATGKGAPLYI